MERIEMNARIGGLQEAKQEKNLGERTESSQVHGKVGRSGPM